MFFGQTEPFVCIGGGGAEHDFFMEGEGAGDRDMERQRQSSKAIFPSTRKTLSFPICSRALFPLYVSLDFLDLLILLFSSSLLFLPSSVEMFFFS